jgi:hypothetical protein
MTVQPQSPYRVVVTREHRSWRTNRTLHDEVIWIGSLAPVPTKNELGPPLMQTTRRRTGSMVPDSDLRNCPGA